MDVTVPLGVPAMGEEASRRDNADCPTPASWRHIAAGDDKLAELIIEAETPAGGDAAGRVGRLE